MPKHKPLTAYGPEPRTPVELELGRTVELLQTLFDDSRLTQGEIADRCGWDDSRVSRLLSGGYGIRYFDLFTVLEALRVGRRDFFYRLYP